MENDLKNFLVKAKKATYAGGGKETLLGDGCRELYYTECCLKYRDRYFGSRNFSGQEVVFRNEKVIWIMNYHGVTKTSRLFSNRLFKF